VAALCVGFRKNPDENSSAYDRVGIRRAEAVAAGKTNRSPERPVTRDGAAPGKTACSCFPHDRASFPATARKSSMITFTKKTETKPVAEETSDNRFEQIRKAATERHKKSDTDGAKRRERQTAEDNRLV